jgi:hypothetical protein
MLRVTSIVVSLAAAVCALALPARAQSSSAASQPGSSPSASFASAPRTDSSHEVEITLPSVTASGAPRSYQVVSIPLPDAFASSSDVEVVIVPRGDFAILGPRTRNVNVRAGQKRVGITVGIPASALAGRLVAAEAHFISPGSPTLIVPIEIDVSLVRKIVVHPAAGPINAQAGSDVILPFDIANSGNAIERINMELALPTGWSAREMHQGAMAIAPGETVKRRLRLKVPALSSTGSSFVHIGLLAGADTVASETMTIEVFNSSSIGRQAGPLITSAYSHALDENGRANQIVTVTATGALYDSVRVDARVSQGSLQGGAASNAFAHLGTYQSAASVVLSAPSGQASFGNTGTSFSDLTGLYPYGQGALVQLQHPDWNLLTFGALSMPAVGATERKPMLGVRAEHQVGVAQLSTSISHLADAGLSPRRLDAVGIGAAVPAFLGSTFKAEIAERRFQDGSGLGWSSGLVRMAGESNEELRITHAPGGSDAYARATNEVIANASERMSSRASISASAWRTTDATAVFSGLKSNGFSLRPQYAIRSGTTIALEARSYRFDANSRPTASGTGGAFGSREQQLGFSISTYVHQYYLNSAAYLGNVTRTVTPVGLSTVSDRTPRNYWTTNAGWSGSGGVLELQTRIEQTRDRGGFVNQQSLFGIHADQLVLPWLGGIRGETELQRVNGFGNEQSSIMRAGLAVPIVNGFSIKVDAERNSIFRSLKGRVPWVFGIRFEHALTVPMLRTPGTSGYVYEDLNGNQRRDDGEPGVAGAIVRRGSETAVADQSGKYRVAGDARQPVTIDEASLPDGWSANGASRGDLSVSLSTSAEVELLVAPRSGISDVQVDLSKAHVIARDSAGREWGAIMSGPTTATFQSLPVGTYKLEFDLSELSEPLVPRAPVPLLIVTGKDSRSISITLDPRPIRMWNGSGTRGSQKSDPPANTPEKKAP